MPTVPNLANSAVIPITNLPPDVTMNQSEVAVPPAGQYHIQKKKRTASAETIAKLEEAEEMRELALIFNTTKGLKGGYGGLGLDVNQAQERTIDEIIDATTPGIIYEQKRIDQINVYEDKPTYYIVLLVPSAEAIKLLGPQSEVHKTISYHIHGRDQPQPRSDVSIIITTPDRVPHLPMFGDRTNKSLPAGGLLPGIPIVVYLQDTRQNFLHIPDVLAWLMEDIMDDFHTVLKNQFQPMPGFTIQVAPNQPSRLASRNGATSTTGMGISIKLYLIAPPPLDPRDINSVTGVLLPTPLLMPRRYVKVPETVAEYVSEWDYHPDDPNTTQLTRSERCRGGPRGMGDGVMVRYIAPTYSSGTLLTTSKDDERFFRIGPYDPETDAKEGLELWVPPKSHSNERRKVLRANASKLANRIDATALRAHKAAQEAVYFSTGVCQEALERISKPNGSTFIPAEYAQHVATTLDPPAELLAAACRNAACKTKMCISLRAITSAVVDARIDGRTEAANRLTAAKIDAELTSRMGARPEQSAPHAASSSGGYHTVQKSSTAPRPPNPHYGADAPILRDPAGKGGGKGKGKGKGFAPTAGKGKGTPFHSVDRLRATDGTGVHGTVRPTNPPMSAVSMRMAPAPIRKANSTNIIKALISGTPPFIALSRAPGATPLLSHRLRPLRPPNPPRSRRVGLSTSTTLRAARPSSKLRPA